MEQHCPANIVPKNTIAQVSQTLVKIVDATKFK